MESFTFGENDVATVEIKGVDLESANPLRCWIFIWNHPINPIKPTIGAQFEQSPGAEKSRRS